MGVEKIFFGFAIGIILSIMLGLVFPSIDTKNTVDTGFIYITPSGMDCNTIHGNSLWVYYYSYDFSNCKDGLEYKSQPSYSKVKASLSEK